MFCSNCGANLSNTARFCSKCGRPVADSGETVLGEESLLGGGQETIAPDSAAPKTPLRSTPRPSHRDSGAGNSVLTTSDPITGGRFAPGVVLCDRYRIVARLGRGGMGEVYRAEDLKLSQVVAIKFLPEALAKDASMLARFHSEVRVARQVAHPNVCRMFDIGDADGVPFLTMEYVDGEDLSSLIRRIGRLPQDKALEVSRQICAGLAAAHERGVIHRDLKPANLMLDGAGKIRVTDFGLAGIAANIQGAEVRAGTPAYMAPEQLSGKEVTAKSDIYSLGLVMYEILTGKRAFDATTLPELMKARDEGKITNPSSVVRDMDPLIERVIMRCLEKDPAKRPTSALQVAAALPGGDPLAAALAAGETPSPEMVAAAGENEGLKPRVAAACLAAAILLLIGCAVLGSLQSGLKRIAPQVSQEVMKHKAQEIIARFGYTEPAVDSATGFSYADDYLDFLTTQGKPSAGWWAVLAERPPLLRFWYRQSSQRLAATRFASVSLTPGTVSFDDPPQIASGMINLRLDPTGRLLYFQAIPPQKEESTESAAGKPDWASLFAAAELNEGDFHSATPVWNSLASPDTRAAWDGVWPGTKRPLHIEAASWRGKPVFFLLAGPWTTPHRMAPPAETGAQKAARIFGTAFVLFLFGGSLWLAFRNHRRGRGDWQGARKLAGIVFALLMLVFLATAHLSFSGDTLFFLSLAISTGLFMSGFAAALYLALEPYVRRNWPQTIYSWSRLMTARLQDPLIGRDVLFGVVLGLLWVVVFFAGWKLDMRRGGQPLFASLDFLMGARATLSFWLNNVVVAIVAAMMFFFVLVFLRIVVRNRWVAAALFVAIFALPKILGSDYPMIDGPVWVLIYVIAAFCVVRFGLVVLGVASFTANMLLNLPYTLDFSEWYSPNSLAIVLGVVALAGWGFYTSLAGQKLWKDELFE